MEEGLQRVGMESSNIAIKKLPKEMLQRVFSDLDMNDLVRLSVYTSGWKHLWATTPYIILNDQHQSIIDENRNFIKFVNSVFKFRNGTYGVDSFSLSWNARVQLSALHDWLGYAITHHVRVMNVHIGDIIEHTPIILPQCLLSCESIEELELECEHQIIDEPKAARLRQLRKLYLSDAILNFQVDKLYAGSPEIEELRLDSCLIKSGMISSRYLKILTIENCHIREAKVILDCPSLEELIYVNNDLAQHTSILNSVYFGNLPVISKVTLVGDDNATRIPEIMNVIENLSAAQEIRFSTKNPELLQDKDFLELPMFHKLRKLSVGVWRDCNELESFNFVRHLLRYLPKLENLTLRGERENLCATSILIDNGIEESSSQQIPFHLLKNIDIRIAGSRDRAEDLVHYLLPWATISAVL